MLDARFVSCLKSTLSATMKCAFSRARYTLPNLPLPSGLPISKSRSDHFCRSSPAPASAFADAPPDTSICASLFVTSPSSGMAPVNPRAVRACEMGRARTRERGRGARAAGSGRCWRIVGRVTVCCLSCPVDRTTSSREPQAARDRPPLGGAALLLLNRTARPPSARGRYPLSAAMESAPNGAADPITGARNFVVRLGDSLAKTGIVVDDGGAIQSAPGGLFDAGYVVAAIDGQPFRPSMRDVGGPQTVTVRCENADVLASLAKVPAKRLRDKTLKMLQVQVSPDDKGFGIDLADFNGVAAVVAGGAAAASEIRAGDIIVAVDNVNTGTKRVAQVLTRGLSTYTFTVVRLGGAPARRRSYYPGGGGRARDRGGGADGAVRGCEPAGRDVDHRRVARREGRRLRALPAAVAAGGGVGVVDHRGGVGAQDDGRHEGQPSRPPLRVSRARRPPTSWGGFTPPTPPTRPVDVAAAAAASAAAALRASEARAAAQSEVGVLSAITERTERSEVSASTPKGDGEGGAGVNYDVLQSVLTDQRQAMEKQHHAELVALETSLHERVTHAEEDAAEWKAKFLEVQGTQMKARASTFERPPALSPPTAHTPSPPHPPVDARGEGAGKEGASLKWTRTRRRRSRPSARRRRRSRRRRRRRRRRGGARRGGGAQDGAGRREEDGARGARGRGGGEGQLRMRQAAAEIKTKVGEAEARTQQAVDRAVAEAVAATRRQADAERREALAAARSSGARSWRSCRRSR